MKRISIIIMMAAVILPWTGASAATNLSVSLRGRILLQTESKGQAWFVLPQSGTRAFLGRPADAFRIMRELGLGISNANLSKITVDSRYPEPKEIVGSKTYDVVMYNFAFSPKNITIRLGDSVNWINQDPASHTITPAGKTLSGFGSGTIMPGQNYSFKFSQRGTFNYKCSTHPYMTGSIIVK